MHPLQLAPLRNVVADPVSAVLLAVGLLLLAASMLVFGYLTVGGVVAALTPERA